MMVSGVGTIRSFYYNTKEGIMSSMKKSEEDCFNFYSSELQTDETKTMNVYDDRLKTGLMNCLEIWQQFRDTGKLMTFSKKFEEEEASVEATIHPARSSRFREVSTEYYSFVPEPEIGKGGLRILIDGATGR